MSLYAKGQLVWAKIKGYPWWPAVVAKTNLDKYGLPDKEILVNFIGENSHALLTQDKVDDFAEKFKKHSSSKNRKLQLSIQVAQKIQSGLSTYEEEREKLIRNEGRLEDSPDRDEVKPARKGRPAKKLQIDSEHSVGGKESEVNFKDKENTPIVTETMQVENEHDKEQLYNFQEEPTEEIQKSKGSPKSQKSVKESKVVQKQKMKEKEKERKQMMETEDFQDYLPFRLTRAQMKGNIGDWGTEHVVENKSKGKAGKDETNKGNKKDKENPTTSSKQVKENRETPSKPVKIKGRLLLDEDDMFDDYKGSRMLSMPSMPARVEESLGEAHSKPTERKFSGDSKATERKYSGDKASSEEGKSRSSKQGNTPGASGSMKSEKRKVEDVVAKVAVAAKASENLNVSTAESANSEANVYHKRSNSAILKDSPPKYTTQVKERNAEVQDECEEQIIKKVKQPVEPVEAIVEEKKLVEKQVEKAVSPRLDHNRKMIKEFEENLAQILDKLSNKLHGAERLKDYDVDIIKILGIIEDFEGLNFDGSEFIGSDLGKIFKTIQFLLVKNKHRLPKTGDLLLTALAKILHRIKDKIIKFCLDNTDYMDALHLPKDKPKPLSMTAIDIDFEEIKAKIEEIGTENRAETAPIATKIEEESTSAYSQVNKTPLNPTELNVPRPPQPVTGSAHAHSHPHAHIKEVPKEPVRESPVIRPSEPSPNDITLVLRKKICQKLAKLLQRVYHMEKDKAQELTLHIEDKLNKFYMGSINEYKQAIKGLHRLIKIRHLSLDELTHVLGMSLYQFNQMLREKIPEMADTQPPHQPHQPHGHTHGHVPHVPHVYNSIQVTQHMDHEVEYERRKQPHKAEDTSAFDFNTYLATKLDHDLAARDISKKEEGDCKQKMLVEPPNSFIQDLFQAKEEEV